MDSIVFYHKDCVDGAGAAWAAWKYFDNTVTYKGLDHSPEANKELLEAAEGKRKVWFLDYAPKRKTLETLLENKSQVWVLDHHISAIRDIEDIEHPLFDPNFDLERSGAGIAWDFFHGERPAYINFIEAIDLHKTDYPNFWYATAYFDQFHLKDINAIIQTFETIEKTNINHLLQDGELISKSKRPLIDHILDKVVWAEVAGYKVATFNSTYFQLRELNDEAPNASPETFSILWNVVEGGRVRCSLRTKSKDLDVSLIAKDLASGGGHKQAAGCMFDSLLDFMDKVRFINE